MKPTDPAVFVGVAGSRGNVATTYTGLARVSLGCFLSLERTSESEPE